MTSIAPISVIIPCYDCAHTIQRTVNSIVGQTLKPFEVLCVNDCSTDQTLEELQKLQNIFGSDWLKIITLTKNSGPSIARNTGWENATQPYIAFLDADDTWHPKKIEIQYCWMKDHPNVALTGFPGTWIRKETEIPKIAKQILAYRVTPFKFFWRNQFWTSSTMLKHDIPFRFKENKKYAEDTALYAEILLSGFPIYRLSSPLVYYYKAPYGEGGLSANLWELEKGELDIYDILRQKKLMSSQLAFIGKVFSFVKFLRRVVIVMIRQLKNSLAGNN